MKCSWPRTNRCMTWDCCLLGRIRSLAKQGMLDPPCGFPRFQHLVSKCIQGIIHILFVSGSYWQACDKPHRYGMIWTTLGFPWFPKEMLCIPGGCPLPFPHCGPTRLLGEGISAPCHSLELSHAAVAEHGQLPEFRRVDECGSENDRYTMIYLVIN